jgi:hypothetical protein
MAIRKKTNKKKVQTKAADRPTRYWILVLNPHDWVRERYHPQAILDVMWEKGYWGLKGKSAGVKSIQKGDVVLLYIASPYKAFGGCGIVTHAHGRFRMTARRYYDQRYRPLPQDGILFKGLVKFETQVPIPALIKKLRFTRGLGPSWGLALRGAARPIDRRDFIKIIKAAGDLNSNLSSRAETIILKAAKGTKGDK